MNANRDLPQYYYITFYFFFILVFNRALFFCVARRKVLCAVDKNYHNRFNFLCLDRSKSAQKKIILLDTFFWDCRASMCFILSASRDLNSFAVYHKALISIFFCFFLATSSDVKLIELLPIFQCFAEVTWLCLPCFMDKRKKHVSHESDKL